MGFSEARSANGARTGYKPQLVLREEQATWLTGACLSKTSRRFRHRPVLGPEGGSAGSRADPRAARFTAEPRRQNLLLNRNRASSEARGATGGTPYQHRTPEVCAQKPLNRIPPPTAGGREGRGACAAQAPPRRPHPEQAAAAAREPPPRPHLRVLPLTEGLRHPLPQEDAQVPLPLRLLHRPLLTELQEPPVPRSRHRYRQSRP